MWPRSRSWPTGWRHDGGVDAAWRSFWVPISTARPRCGWSTSTAVQPVHQITDVNVTSQLIGDFTDTHLTGANDAVIATDTQKNTVYAMARTGGITSPEEFALRLARNYVDKYEQVTGARMAVEQYSWDRISDLGRTARPRVLQGHRRGQDHRRPQGRRRRDGDLRADRSGGAEVDRQRILGFPRRRIHLAGGDRRPHSGDRGFRALALLQQRPGLGQDLHRRSAT